MARADAVQPPRRKRMAGLLAVLIGLAALVLLVRHFADLAHFVTLARQVQPAWLLVALALQVSTYVAVAWGWAIVLRRAGAPQPLRKLLPVAVSKLFADQALPGAGPSWQLVAFSIALVGAYALATEMTKRLFYSRAA